LIAEVISFIYLRFVCKAGIPPLPGKVATAETGIPAKRPVQKSTPASSYRPTQKHANAQSETFGPTHECLRKIGRLAAA
jgi:hypothetical protein